MEPVRVRGHEVISVDIGSLVNLQPESFKDLTEERYVRLRNSIVSKGFSFPLFVWVSPEGTKYITDGHQRVRTLKKMRDEGVEVPLLPAWKIEARDKVEAKELLLLSDSRYGKLTREGFDEFIDEVGFEVDSSLEDLLSFPELEMYPKEKEDEQPVPPTGPKGVICPSCGHHFTPES